MLNAYHIVFGLDDNYAKYCAVTMSSIVHSLDLSDNKAQNSNFQGKSENSHYAKPIYFYLIADTLTH